MVKNIHLIGMPRSGTYAISNWILSQGWPKKMKFHDFLKSYDTYFKKNPVKGYNLFRYERIDLLSFYQDLKKYGETGNGSIYYIIRDPYNYFASVIKLWYTFKKKKRQGLLTNGRRRIVDGWKEYAKQALGLKSYLIRDAKIINYNKWFMDTKYRKSLSLLMGVDFSDKSLQKVKSFPNPKQKLVSSFDKQKYDGRAQKMKVLERWKVFKDNKLYLDMFDDEVIQYASKLFFSPPFKKK